MPTIPGGKTITKEGNKLYQKEYQWFKLYTILGAWAWTNAVTRTVNQPKKTWMNGLRFVYI